MFDSESAVTGGVCSAKPCPAELSTVRLKGSIITSQEARDRSALCVCNKLGGSGGTEYTRGHGLHTCRP
jgi:hypothetical protein